MIAPGLLPEGLRDRLPPQAQASATLVRNLTDSFAAFGYERVQPPLVEYEESLGSRLGGAARRELLRFTDPVSQHTLALRSDMTGQVGRIAVTRLAEAARPLRLSYAGPVLRVRGTQLNPERESVQVGAELIGSDSPQAAAEVIALAVSSLRATGLQHLSLDITMPMLVADLAAAGWPLGSGTLEQVQALLDGKDVAGLIALGAGAYEPLITAAGPADAALIRLGALPLPPGVADHVLAIAELVAGLHDVTITLDPTERHGFEYQTWIGFSLFGAGIPGEAGRGGAYHIMSPDGSAEPAIGFSLFVDSLVDAGLGITDPHRILLPHGTAPAAGAALRGQGWSTVAAFAPGATPQEFRCTHIWNGVEPQSI